MRNHEELLEINNGRHNRVDHVKSSRSDGQPVRRNLHSLSPSRNFSRPSLNNKLEQLRDPPYQQKQDKCWYIKKRIQEAQEDLEKEKQESEKLYEKIQETQNKLDQLLIKKGKIQIRLESEQDRLMLAELEIKAEFTDENIKMVQQELSQLKQDHQRLEQRMDYKRNFIKEQRQTLDKEQYPSQRLPQINRR